MRIDTVDLLFHRSFLVLDTFSLRTFNLTSDRLFVLKLTLP